MTKMTPINDFLGSVAMRGMSFLGMSADSGKQDADALIKLCKHLISTKGNASGLALAHKILTTYSDLETDEKTKFFLCIVEEFGWAKDETKALVESYAKNPTERLLQQIATSATPQYAPLISRLNQRPASTLPIVRMRADLLSVLPENPSLKPLDDTFKDVLSSWFNRGFLELQKIDWQAPAAILENIIRYEAVHGMAGWEDLARRIKPDDRLIYGFFHRNLIDEPLIFVEVALTTEVPTSIDTILSDETPEIDPDTATTAVFYSISNCQAGLRGIELGNFLIKQVVRDLQKRHPSLKEFITLSPIIKFGDWMREQVEGDTENAPELPDLNTEIPDAAMLEAAAWFLSQNKAKSGLPSDPVCKFHIGNGARLEQLNWGAQTNSNGLRNAFGIMANYKYIIDDIEKNHEAFVQDGTVTTSPSVRKLAVRYQKKMSASLGKE